MSGAMRSRKDDEPALALFQRVVLRKDPALLRRARTSANDIVPRLSDPEVVAFMDSHCDELDLQWVETVILELLEAASMSSDSGAELLLRDERRDGRPKATADLNNRGWVLKDQGDLPGARACFERALAIDERAHGPDHASVAIDLNNLGWVLKDQGDLPGARACFERALAIDERAHGPDHPSVARDVNNLGVVAQDLGDLSGAQAALERALVIFERAPGPQRPHVATTEDNLDLVRRAQGDFAGASDRPSPTNADEKPLTGRLIYLRDWRGPSYVPRPRPHGGAREGEGEAGFDLRSKVGETFEARVGEAFEQRLLVGLPDKLADVSGFFRGVEEVGHEISTRLRARDDVRHGGNEAYLLAQFGLTPMSFASAAHGVAKFARRRRRASAQKAVDAEVILEGREPWRERRRGLVVPRGRVIREVEWTTELAPSTSERLLEWLIAVAAYRPGLFDGFIARPEEDALILSSSNEALDLFDGWSAVSSPSISGLE